MTFKNRYHIEKSTVLDDNFRSTKGIVDVAHTIIKNDTERVEDGYLFKIIAPEGSEIEIRDTHI